MRNRIAVTPVLLSCPQPHWLQRCRQFGVTYVPHCNPMEKNTPHTSHTHTHRPLFLASRRAGCRCSRDYASRQSFTAPLHSACAFGAGWKPSLETPGAPVPTRPPPHANSVSTTPTHGDTPFSFHRTHMHTRARIWCALALRC